MPRKAIPPTLKNKLLYESQYCCAICQKSGCQIHHIDQDHSNNTEDNLIVLCVAHHDEAHTMRTMSNNLDARALRHAKSEWTKQVRNSRTLAATLEGQTKNTKNGWLSVGVSWGYINHKRVAEMSDIGAISNKGQRLLKYCLDKEMVDENAIIIKPLNSSMSNSFIRNSVYNWFDFGDDQRLHALYSEMVDQISRNTNVIHLEPSTWTKARVRSLVRPGGLIFFNKGVYFKSIDETQENDHRRCQTFKNKVHVEFYVDTIDMFGATSKTVSFQGHQTCAALLLVKSLGERDDGGLVLSCTPLALGVGFRGAIDIQAS
ncbi:HNH endonuclease [Billgrantia tianxiuensis]|uniref:HNH endonuclease n=1 Tax=Billgrantia tianxiuensis TaxID=2497861 RepID=A0A6I6SKI4_9GAMM|nr:MULTISPECIES: HNH endonuclease signature motif containing protein [Halomonas]MCE8032180.1 HNH endonuclease [Halomonas sp. MCCC 1A11057]QHC49801.1 HNH endonuclease [Halomonas tianxiuensis]